MSGKKKDRPDLAKRKKHLPSARGGGTGPESGPARNSQKKERKARRIEGEEGGGESRGGWLGEAEKPEPIQLNLNWKGIASHLGGGGGGRKTPRVIEKKSRSRFYFAQKPGRRFEKL